MHFHLVFIVGFIYLADTSYIHKVPFIHTVISLLTASKRIVAKAK